MGVISFILWIIAIILSICLYCAIFSMRDSLENIAKELKRMNDLKDGGNEK